LNRAFESGTSVASADSLVHRILCIALIPVCGCHASSTSEAEGLDGGPTDSGLTDSGVPDSGPPTVSVGGSCTADSMCIPVDNGGKAECLQGGPYPDGYCSQKCTAQIGSDCGLYLNAQGFPTSGPASCEAFLFGPDGGSVTACYENCDYSPDAGLLCSRPGYVCGDYVAPGGIGLGPTVGPVCMASCSTNADCNQGGGTPGVCAFGAVVGGGGTEPVVSVPDAGVCVPACTSNAQCLSQNFCHHAAGDPLQGQCGLAPIQAPSSDTGTAIDVHGLGTSWFLVASGNQLFWADFLPLSLLMTATTTPNTTPEVLSTGNGAPPPFGGSDVGSMATDGENLYWTGPSDVYQLALVRNTDGGISAGTFITLASGLASSPVGVAVDSKNVYWATAGNSTPPGTGGIFFVPIGGGATTTISTTENAPQGLATDGVNLYWTDFGYFVPDAGAPGGFIDPPNGTVVAADLSTLAIRTVASGQAAPLTIATDGTNVYWVNSGNYVFKAAEGTFGPPPDLGAVMQVAVNGGPPIALASAQDSPYWLTTAEGEVFWTNEGSSLGSVQGDEFVGTGTLYMASAGKGPTLILAGIVYPSGLTATEGNLYFSSASTGFSTGNGAIWSFPIPKGP
jgi:hypothetical protein